MEVFDVLLQILDDGRLTDGHGRTVDFRNTVIIMTSNVRSREAMRDVFRPEFLNRIDEIIEFHALSREQLGEIVELQLERLRERLAARGVGLELTDEAKELLAEEGWDPTYGARPLKRAIQRLVENPLALRLLEGEFREGDTVQVEATRGRARFRARRGSRARGCVACSGHLARAAAPATIGRCGGSPQSSHSTRDRLWHHRDADADEAKLERLLRLEGEDAEEDE